MNIPKDTFNRFSNYDLSTPDLNGRVARAKKMKKNKYITCLILLLSTASSSSYATEKEVEETTHPSNNVIATNIGFSEPVEITKITSRVNGYIKKWNFKKGDKVVKGDIILEIEDDKASPSIKSIMKKINVAEKELSSKERLLSKKYASKVDVLDSISVLEDLKNQLERARYLKENRTITAPYTGILRKKETDEGEYVSSGKLLGEFYNPKKVDIYSNIYNFDKLCNGCKIVFKYNGENYGPYKPSYRIKNLDVGFDITKVGVLFNNSPIPYGVTVDIMLVK